MEPDFSKWDFGRPKKEEDTEKEEKSEETPEPQTEKFEADEAAEERENESPRKTGWKDSETEGEEDWGGLNLKPQTRAGREIDPALWWKTLMATVSEKHVTDIIFSPESKDAFIRVNTELELYQRIGKENYEPLIRFQIPEGRAKELDEVGEIDFALTCFTRRMRTNIFKTLKGLSAAFRPLPNKSIPWRENGLTSHMMHIIDTTKQGLVLVTGPTGSGKSLAYGTPVMRYDGLAVPVESLKVGDRLMGPDWKARTVTQTQPGRGNMLEIVPKNGNPWKCNEDHILTLKRDSSLPLTEETVKEGCQGTPERTGEIIDVNVKDLMEAAGKEVSRNWKLFRAGWPAKDGSPSRIFDGIDFEIRPAGVGDYFGILLDGDGRFLLGDLTVTHNSTTLCSMLEYVNEKYPYHIITIEDPIEYIFSNRRSLINQREVGEHTKGFQTALRASLRENPDIIFVGEMRDYETARTALMAADTGHLVFGTLHTRRVYTTISRLLEMAPESSRAEMRAMLSGCLAMVLCQRLLQKRGGGIWPCREVMMLNPAISALIKEGKEKGISNQLTINQARGMMEWGKALDIGVQNGMITEEEKDRYTDSTEDVF